MSTNVYGKGLSGLLKRGWAEIPGVMGGLVMALLGVGIGFFGITYKDSTIDPKYKMDYIVYRSDDPRAKRPVRE